MSSPSTFGSSCSMTSIFPEIFAPPRIATNGRFGFSSAPPRYSSSFSISKPGDGRLQVLRHALGRRVRAVRRAERVVHVEVAELRECSRQALVVLLLAAEEARVLEQERPLRIRRVAACTASSGVGRLDEDHRAPQQLARAAWPPAASEYFASGFPFGRPRCERITTRAPRSSSSSIVGSAARMRVSSVMRRRRRAAR